MEEAPPAPRPPAEAQPPRPPGLLSLNTRPWSKVYMGPRLIGTTPIGRAEIRSGTVRLRLVDRDGTTHQRTVRVEPGEETRAFFDLSAPAGP
jgi:serine/threonine-protein kinase